MTSTDFHTNFNCQVDSNYYLRPPPPPLSLRLLQKTANPLLINVPLLYPLKAPENQMFSEVCRGYKMGTLVKNG